MKLNIVLIEAKYRDPIMPEPRSNVSQKNFDPSVYSLVQIFAQWSLYPQRGFVIRI